MAGNISGLTRYFEQLRSLLELSSRHMENASEEYCEYVQERLETSIISLSRFQQILT